MNYSLLLALSIGDGFVEKQSKKNTSCLRIRHSNHQLDYINWKYDLDSSFWRNKPRPYKNINKGKRYYGHQLRSKPSKDLVNIRELLYPDNKKKITREALDLLNEQGLAIWFMDDGCCDRPLNKKPMGILNTYGNSNNGLEEIIIKDYFQEKWNIEVKLNKNHGRYRLRFNNYNFNKFVEITKNHIIPSLQYKINLNIRCNAPTKKFIS